MPKLVDDAARLAFVREAAFTVVLEQGVGALSLRAVRGTSVNTVRRLLAAETDLVELAADEVARRRRHGWLGVLRDAPPADAAVHLLRKLLPDVEKRIPDELVWLRLLLETSSVITNPEDGLTLVERFRTSEGGETVEGAVCRRPPRPDRLQLHRAERDKEFTTLVDWSLDLLETPTAERPARAREVSALISGLTVEVCLRHLSPPDAVAVLDRQVQIFARLG